MSVETGHMRPQTYQKTNKLEQGPPRSFAFGLDFMFYYSKYMKPMTKNNHRLHSVTVLLMRSENKQFPFFLGTPY